MTESEMVKADVLVEGKYEVLVAVSFGVSGIISARATSVHRTNATASGLLPPTLTASTYGSNQGGSGGRLSGKPRPSIDKLVAILPTPTVSGDWNRRGASQYSGDGLASVAGLSIRLREWMMGAAESWTQVADEKP